MCPVPMGPLPPLLLRFDEIFVGENFLQTVLHAHLLIEKALVKQIEAKFARPEVLSDRQFAQLSFAQKVAVYVGLYAPEKRSVDLLLGFNKLRNKMAHDFVEDEASILTCLGESIHPNPLKAVKIAFGYLAFFELGAVHGIRRTDIEWKDEETPWVGGAGAGLIEEGDA